jgi:hypothetical protein
MIHIKQFLERVSLQESKNNKTVVITIDDARGLRDEISKLMADYYKLSSIDSNKEDIIKVEITGGSFK